MGGDPVMADRISDPWGERTPYGAGQEWPVRVDEHLPAGEPERWAQAASLLHSNSDAMDIAIADGRIAGVRGRAQDRVNRGSRLLPAGVQGRRRARREGQLSMHLAHYLGLLHRSQIDLAQAFREVAEAHPDEADVVRQCERLAGQCAAHAERLEPFAARYGEEAEGETELQLKWLRTRMKQAAPQALVVA